MSAPTKSEKPRKGLPYANENLDSWVERVRSGDPRALARAISAVEDHRPESVPLLKALFPHTGKARILGLTGAPGAGKSTLVDQLAREYRKQERSIGIIAVDPTSPFSGGAILGDRIRMLAHHGDPGIYIRSMATRGSLGGLARTTSDAASVLDASGKDLILIETVGVGQDEVEIVRLADVTIVMVVPGMGDDVQTIMADTIAEYEEYLGRENLVLKKKAQNWRERLLEMLRDSLLEGVLRRELNDGELARYATDIAEHRRDPYSLVEELTGKLGKS